MGESKVKIEEKALVSFYGSCSATHPGVKRYGEKQKSNEKGVCSTIFRISSCKYEGWNGKLHDWEDIDTKEVSEGNPWIGRCSARLRKQTYFKM